LAQPLRRDLEDAFGASLAAVRIHHDAAAAIAASEFRANAFASGADIYFGVGMFRPDTAAGRELLGHEVSHVLQQTGRAGADRKIAATRASGRGTVQRQPIPDDPTGNDKVKWLADGKTAFAALTTRHSKGSAGDATLAKLIEIVKNRFGEELLPNSSSIMEESLRVIATDGFVIEKVPSASDVKWPLTKPAIGFLVDCLKVCGTEDAFKVAATLIDQDTAFELRSAFGPRTAFREFLKDKRSEDWIAAAFAHPAIAKIWPGVFLNTFEQYVLNPGRPRQTLYNYKEMREAELNNIDGIEINLLASDRVVLAIDLLHVYDDLRISTMRQLDEFLEKHALKGGKPQERSAAAALLAEFLGRLRTTARSKAWSDMLGRMQSVASAAADFWVDVAELRQMYLKANAKLGTDMFKAIDPDIKRVFQTADPTFKPLHDALSSAAKPGGIYFLDAAGARADMPTPADYAARIGKLADTLGIRGNPSGNVLLTLQTQLIAQHHARDGLKTDSARAIGLAIWWLLDFKAELLDYKPAEDKDAAKGYTDNRLRHRLHMAYKLAEFSQATGWTDTLADARKIAFAEDTGKSYLIVKGHWNVVDTPIETLQEDADIDIDTVTHNLKLSPHQLALFFHIDVLRQIRAAVAETVKVGRKTGKLDTEDANKKIAAVRRPWKCAPDNPLFVINPKEAEALDRKGTPLSAYDLIQDSPKSKAELGVLAEQKRLGRGWDWLARSKERVGSSNMWAWIVPDMQAFADDLRRLEPFATWMKEAGFDALTGYAWLQKLAEIFPQKKAGGNLKEEIEQALKTEAGTEQSELNKAYRAAIAINRRQTRTRVAAMLVRYKNDRRAHNMFLPRDAVEAIDWFTATVVPQADADVQRSLLVLSLANELDQAFDTVGHTRYVPPLFHFSLTQAVALADKELKDAVSGTDLKMKQAIEALLHVNPDKPAENETLADFDGKRDLLEAVAKRVEEGMKEIQQSSGFASLDGESLKSLNQYPLIEPGRKGAFEMAGDDWELVKVHRPFIYHPALTTAAVTSETAKPILANEKDEPIDIKHEVLIDFLVNGIEYDVYADDATAMAKLSETIFWETFSRAMENLAEGIETGVMILMDLIELVPGVGQELMEARIAAQTAAFLIAELPQIADAVKKDPVELITRIGKELATRYLTLDGLITYVLLGQGFKEAPFDSIRRPEPSKTSTKMPVRGKLGRIIGLLRRLGMRLFHAVQWLQLRVSGPIRSLQSSVETRPKLGWVLRKAVDIGLWLRDVVPPDLLDKTEGKEERKLGILEDLLPGGQEVPSGKTPAEREARSRGLIDTIKGDVAAQGKEFKTQFEERLELLREAQLPGEIVPLESLVGYIIDFFLMRLGAKVRILKSVLEHTQPYKDLKGAIASALADEARGTKVDPNEYWRNWILDAIEQRIVDARNGLVDAMYGLTDSVAEQIGIPEFRLERPETRSKDSFRMEQTPFPKDEVELARVHGAVPDVSGLGALPTTPGQPLAARVRVVEERRFGHDFGHVRVHKDDESAAKLDTVPAHALTSGSHVFLRPGLDPERGPGARILHHELTHVLQQTGERPLGGKHEQKPLRGRKSSGLRIDDLREAAADSMARADNAVAREPVSVDEGAEGVQPALENVAIDMLRVFTQIQGAADFEKAVGPGKVPGEELAGATWIMIKNRLQQQQPSDFQPFAQPVSKPIYDHVAAFDLAKDIRGVAALAQKPLKGARGKKAKTELDYERFVTLLEAVLFARTGISMQIKMAPGPPAKVARLDCGYIHLGLIAPGTQGKSPLWDTVMRETPEILDGEADADVRLEIWERLNVLGPDPFIWKTGTAKFKFSSDFVEAFGKVRSKRKPDLPKQLPVTGASIDPAVVPPSKNEYLNPTGQSGVGLRIGLHGGVKALPKQQGLDRESHHTTQYLLVQFFRNDNSRKAWRSGVDYSGKNAKYGIFPPTGEGRSRFVAPKGTLQLDELDPEGPGKRGAKMPAILISADLHKRGQLHVEREREWKEGTQGDPDSDDSQGRVTQGFAISAQFKRELNRTVHTFDTSPDWDQKMKVPDAADNVFDAMVGTYHWMRSRMLDQLQAGLVTRELAYYRGIAARKPGAVEDAKTGKLKPAYDMSAGALESVFNRAKNNNDSVMRSAGWPA